MLDIKVNINKVMKKIQMISDDIVSFIYDQAEKELKRYVEELKEFIEMQRGQWAPLSDEWARAKERLGLDPRILIATGKYLDSIKLVREGNKFKVIAEGCEELATYLEYGTSKMPARPHFSHMDMRVRYGLTKLLIKLAVKQVPNIKQKYRFLR